MKDEQQFGGYCTLDVKDDTTQGYWYKCNKVLFATITIKVCGVGETEAKPLAEQAMEDLTVAPPGNKINIGCKD